jgi:D-alanyl-D-alanine carboxypeptidase
MVEWVRGQRSFGTFTAAAWRALLPLLLCIALAVPIAEASSAKPRFSAIAVDAKTGKILFSRDPDGVTHPASLTKMMTLYILFGELKAGRVKLDTQLKVSSAAAAQAPTKLGLKPGQTISAGDAIKALVTLSANDAAVAIAENLAPSEGEFAARMTRIARDLGMSRTVFRNASGLPDPGQVTTARDMAMLGLRLQRDFPQYYPYFRTMSFTYAGKVIKTHNRLLGRYAGADGIKTGYIRASGFNLTSSAKRGNKRIIGVVLGASSGSSRNVYMMAMLDKAFPKCKDGTALASAVEGTSPKKTVEPPPKEAKVAAEPVKPVAKPAKIEQPQKAIDTDQSTDEEAAEEGGDETSEGGKTVETAVAEPAVAQEPAADSSAMAQTVLSKTSPDGTPLPFAIKKSGDDAGGVIVIPEGDLSWHIQIGAYPSKKDAQAVLYKIRALDLALLDQKQALTIEVQKGKDILYRARFSGFTEKNAHAACEQLTKQGFRCVAMQPQS